MQNAWPISYVQQLLQQITINFCIDLGKRVKLVRKPDFYNLIKLDIIIKGKKKAIKTAKKHKPGLIL